MRAPPATPLRPFDLHDAPMRALLLAWAASFIATLALALGATLMPLACAHLGLSGAQLRAIVAAVLVSALLSPLVAGWFCDRVGPRRTHTVLLVLAGLPLVLAPLASGFAVLVLLCTLGTIGSASIVVSCAHTARMVAPPRLGLVIAIGAAWASSGALLAWCAAPVLVSLGEALAGEAWSWRVVPAPLGALVLASGFVVYRFTQDQPDGDQRALERASRQAPVPAGALGVELRDPRLGLAAIHYAGSVAAKLALVHAVLRGDHALLGIAVVLAGLAARVLAGWLSDRAGALGGTRGRHAFLAAWLALQGIALIALSMLDSEVGPLRTASTSVIAFGAGASLALAPLVAQRAAGGAIGAVASFGPVGAMVAFVALAAEPGAGGAGVAYLGLATIALAALTPLALNDDAVIAGPIERAP